MLKKPSRTLTHPTFLRRGPQRVITIILLLAAGPGFATTVSAADPAAVVENFFRAYRAGDVARMLSLYAEDAIFTDVSQRHEVEGREGLSEQLGRLVAIHKAMDVEVKRQAVTGDLVTVEVDYTGTLDCAALGRPDHEDLEYVLPAVLLFEIEDGHIRRQTDYLDFRTFTETFAALQNPAPGD